MPNIVSMIIIIGALVLITAGTIGTLWFVRVTYISLDAMRVEADRMP